MDLTRGARGRGSWGSLKRPGSKLRKLGPAPAGLFFCPMLRSHTGMDESLERIIRQVLEDARARGRDHLAQTVLAVRTVREVRPDMTAPEALSAVEFVQRS